MAHYDLAGTPAAKVYVIVGLAILAFFSWKLYDDSCFLQRAVQGRGRIVYVEQTSSYGTKGSYNLWVDVQYTTSSHQAVVAHLYDQGPRYSRYRLGDAVTFLYDPDSPEKVRPAKMVYQYPWVWLLLMGSGIVLAWMGGKILWSSRRQSRSLI